MSSVSESGPPSPVPSLSPRAASPEPDADASVTVVLDKVQKYGIFITFGGKEYLIPEERLTAEQKKILEEIETTVRRLSRNPDQLIKSFEFDLKNCIMIEHYLGARTPVTRHLTSNIPWIISLRGVVSELYPHVTWSTFHEGERTADDVALYQKPDLKLPEPGKGTGITLVEKSSIVLKNQLGKVRQALQKAPNSNPQQQAALANRVRNLELAIATLDQMDLFAIDYLETSSPIQLVNNEDADRSVVAKAVAAAEHHIRPARGSDRLVDRLGAAANNVRRRVSIAARAVWKRNFADVSASLNPEEREYAKHLALMACNGNRADYLRACELANVEPTREPLESLFINLAKHGEIDECLKSWQFNRLFGRLEPEDQNALKNVILRELSPPSLAVGKRQTGARPERSSSETSLTESLSPFEESSILPNITDHQGMVTPPAVARPVASPSVSVAANDEEDEDHSIGSVTGNQYDSQESDGAEQVEFSDSSSNFRGAGAPPVPVRSPSLSSRSSSGVDHYYDAPSPPPKDYDDEKYDNSHSDGDGYASGDDGNSSVLDPPSGVEEE